MNNRLFLTLRRAIGAEPRANSAPRFVSETSVEREPELRFLPSQFWFDTHKSWSLFSHARVASARQSWTPVTDTAPQRERAIPQFRPAGYTGPLRRRYRDSAGRVA